jgi:hypothetical protein
MMVIVGYISTWFIGAYLSFVLTVWIIGNRIPGGLEAIPAIIAVGLMAALIWTISYWWLVHP